MTTTETRYKFAEVLPEGWTVTKYITLGQKYIDKITGFAGTATARFEYLCGEAQIQLEGNEFAAGEIPPCLCFSESRLVEDVDAITECDAEPEQSDFSLTRDDDGKLTFAAQYERDRQARATAHEDQVKLIKSIAQAAINEAIRNGGTLNPKNIDD